MLRDPGTSQYHPAMSAGERRASERVPCPAELIVLWHHDLTSPVRYELADASDGGFRVRTSLPMQYGMTGMALKLLPDGRDVNDAVMVVWCRETRQPGVFEVGLRCF
jgi:hypothetical protein